MSKEKKRLDKMRERIIEKGEKIKETKPIKLEKKSDKNTFNSMTFKLEPSQVEKLKEWQGHIKAIYGEYGDYEYRFSSNGIGDIVIVYSELADVTLDLTDIDTW